jgi:hypothetical protein
MELRITREFDTYLIGSDGQVFETIAEEQLGTALEKYRARPDIIELTVSALKKCKIVTINVPDHSG